MSKRCWCDRVHEMLQRDWRFKIIDDGASMLWLALVLAIGERGGDDQMLPLGFDLGSRFGFDVGYHFGSRLGSRPGSVHELALMLGSTETKVETHLPVLLDRDLLVLTRDGIALPPELGLSAKQLAARLNGRKGGRPPGSGKPPDQHSLRFVIPGGRQGKPTETQTETQPGNPLARASLSLQEDVVPIDQEPLGERGGAADASVSVTRRIAAIIGRRDGLKPAEQTMLQTIVDAVDPPSSADELLDGFRSVQSRSNAPVDAPMSYYGKAVPGEIKKARSARGELTLPAASAAPSQPDWPEKPIWEDRWRALVAACGGQIIASRLVPGWPDYALSVRDPLKTCHVEAYGDLFLAWRRFGRGASRPPTMAHFVAAATDPVRAVMTYRWAEGFLAAQRGDGDVPAAWDDFMSGAQQEMLPGDEMEAEVATDMRGAA